MRAIIFLTFFIASSSYGQIEGNIDSLLMELTKSKEDADKVILLNNLSRKYTGIREYLKGFEYGNQSLSLAKKINYKIGEAKAYHNIAKLYGEQDDQSRELEYFLKELRINEIIGEKTAIAASYKNIGQVCKEQGNYLVALD